MLSKPVVFPVVEEDTAAMGVNNITVEFEDGFVLYHARWNQFVRGALHHGQKTVNK